MRAHAGHPMALATGLALWFAWLCLVYGGAAAGCAIAPPPPLQGPWNWINAVLGVATVALVAGLGIAAWRAGRAAARMAGDAPGVARRRFFASTATVMHGVAAAATLVVGLPLLVLAPCV